MLPAHARPTLLALLSLPMSALAANPVCEARSTEALTPVIELYTSEGCSSCPPADQWLSTLKGKPVVAQAFHVSYWDYIGWVDRFASPAHTERQRQLATTNGLRSLYTPQVVRNGRDWRDHASAATPPNDVARASITLQRAASDPDTYEASVSPASDVTAWSAYWSVTEHGHQSRVQAGENRGETLKHDFVVRQYTPVGRYQGTQTLRFNAVAAKPDHPRQVNLVVFDPQNGRPLQALSLHCG